MLTRLKINGFKNLVEADVRFGPFTCIAGPNGVGKSNLFDAIRFLSVLANQPLLEAARSVRDEHGRTGDVRSLFHRQGNSCDDEMSFEAEMIVPKEAIDDLGQTARASMTFLRYSLTLAYRAGESQQSLGAMEIVKEELIHLNRSDAPRKLPFPHSLAWRTSVLHGRRVPPFISTETEGDSRIIKLHQDGGSRGRPLSRSAANLPRTVLSAANAAESPTVLVARREMQSWRLLHLEPSALRKPDEFTASSRLGSDGAHLAATLYRLARHPGNHQANGATQAVYAQIANRLAELIEDVKDVRIDRDDRRELLSLHITDQAGTPHPARSLSDGTLRFLALAVLELDPEAQGLLCLEEPENGIHPDRVPAMLCLLMDLAVDVNQPVGADNPLRQVVVNTHSPAVAQQVPDDSLLIAEAREYIVRDQRFRRVRFSCLSDTWRAKSLENGAAASIIAKGKLLPYLNPVLRNAEDFGEDAGETGKATARKPRRVRDREDVQPLLFPLAEEQ